MQPWSKAIFSEGMFWPALVSRAQAHVHGSFTSFILHHFSKSLENQLGNSSKTTWMGGDGNGNLTKLSRSRWFNIMGPHLRREYHHRWPWWKRGRIRSGTPMPTWQLSAGFTTWIYIRWKSGPIYTLTEADVEASIPKNNMSFRSFKQILILISIIQSYKT